MPHFSRRMMLGSGLALCLLAVGALPAAAAAIRVGVYNFAPLIFLEDGQARGFFLDILQEAAARGGWELTFVPGSWAECLERLEKGEIDLQPVMAVTPDRLSRFDFTDDYLFLDWGVIYQPEGGKIRTVLDLAGKRIAALRSSVYTRELRSLLDQFGVRAAFMEMGEYADVLRAVSDRECDAGICTNVYGAILEDRYAVERTDIVFAPVKIRYGVRKGTQQAVLSGLDSLIRELKADRASLYYRKHEEWMGLHESKALPAWVPWVAGGLLAVALLLGGSSLILRSAVARRTLELEKARAYIQNLFDSMPSALVAVDPQGRVTHWNAAAARTLGLPEGMLPSGRPLGEVFPRLAAQMANIRSALETRAPVKVEKSGYVRDGAGRFEDVVVYPLVANGVDGAVIRLDDVTERVRLEEMMIQTEKMMTVGGLAAGMAHEINNPLSAILQSAQVVQMRLDPASAANRRAAAECGADLDVLAAYLERRGVGRFLDGVREAGLRAARIVANMLDFSRRSESRFSAVRLDALLDRAVELASSDYDLKKKYGFRQIRIERDYAPDLPAVPCVAMEIEQVVLNMLKNAAQAMAQAPGPRPAPVITLRTSRAGNMAVAEVIDNGPGMPPAVRRRAFEPFFTTKEPGQGTGLGLSVSYFIITANHKGNIRVESEPGQGARFVIELPLSQDLT